MPKRKKKRRIRPLALCVFRRGDKIFLSKGRDAITKASFYRPIGGRIEFGEHSAQTIIREIKEEIQAEVTDLRYLGALENIFTFEDQPGHEIVIIYAGRFPDPRLNSDSIRVEGRDGQKRLYTARWHPLDRFRNPNAPPLYPAGLLELLDKSNPA